MTSVFYKILPKHDTIACPCYNLSHWPLSNYTIFQFMKIENITFELLITLKTIMMKKQKMTLPRLTLKKLSIAVLNGDEQVKVNGGISGTPCYSVQLPCIPPTEFQTCRICDRVTRARSCEACIPDTEYMSCRCEPM